MLSRNEVLTRLKARDKAIIEIIYKCLFPGLNHWLITNSGTREDAEDVFHDFLLCVILKLDSQALNLTCDFSTYFISICRNKWLQILYKRKRLMPLTTENLQKPMSDWDELSEMEDAEYIEDQKYHAFIEALNELDPRSQAVMEASLNGKSNEEIAQDMGFINPQAVADKKKNCKKKLIRIISECPLYKNQVNEELRLHRACYK
jgi:RNA polymerase sigma factor (sigma-70 family)